MNNVQIHLALTHVPVILSLVSLIILVVAFFIRNSTLTKTAYILLLVAGIAALPVYLTGEGTEETVENLPGVSETIIEIHEEVAKLALISIIAAGLAASAALFSFSRQKAAHLFKGLVLLLAIVSGALMMQTAHLGGQVRHSEIRSGLAQQNSLTDKNANVKQADHQQEQHED